MTKLLKMYGERNTNTNYLSKLIDLNLDVRQLSGVVPQFIDVMQRFIPGDEYLRDAYFSCTYSKNLGWKHTCVKSSDELKKYRRVRMGLAFVTITKNPYSWLLSLHRRPYHNPLSKNLSFEEFLRQPWHLTKRDQVSAKHVTPVELWNIKNRSYFQLDQACVMHVTSEAMFKDPELIIEQLCRQFSFKRRTENFVNFSRSTKEKSKDFAYYQDYYLAEKWRSDLPSEAVRIINELIDRELMSRFGYQVLDA